MKYVTIILVCISSLAHAQFVTNNGIVITNSANVYTNGDWQNNGTIRNNGTITTSESWQNTGTMDVNSTGGFVLQYATSKSFSAGSNSAKMGFLQKEGAGDAAVTGRVMVKDSLKILSGVIKMNTNADTLGISSTTLVSASNGSYVEGPMAQFGGGTFLFPVGRLAQYWPIKFYNSTSARVGVVLESAPVGFDIGEAVESLTAFPIAWRTVKLLSTDTASYVEVQGIDASVVGITNPILIRKVVGLDQFEGMGSRLVSSDGTNTTIRSYSNGLQGLFSIGNGYPGNLVGDSTELVALFTSTNGNNWTTRTNWNTGFVRSWFGIIEKGGRVTQINMPNNNIAGPVPSTITNVTALKTLNIANNEVTSFPDVTSMPAISTLDISSNNLDFASLEANASLAGSVEYEDQDSVSLPSYNEIPVSTDTTMIIPVGGTSNIYQWKFKGRTESDYSVISGAVSDSYTLASINRTTMGDYILEITNPLVPGLALTSSKHRVFATADIAGTLFENNSIPASSGKMRLLKVTLTGSYDTIDVQDVASNGAYLFDNVLLEDYLVNGYADTLLYAKALPTYFEKTIFWEEADTLVLEDNIAVLDIHSEFKPDPPTTGQGEITGTFYENVGGRTSAKTRVSNSPVTVRRVQGGGRGKEEVLTLIAHTFTDDNGEFVFTKLDEAEYRLNIQLPGYPMDPNSFITIPIVDNLFERQVGVEAEVIDGKIEVRKLVITGWQQETHSVEAYPNPTVDYLYIGGSGSDKNTTLRLHDSSGKIVSVNTTWNQLDQRWELNIKELQAGVYILQVHTNGKTEALQIIIQ